MGKGTGRWLGGHLVGLALAAGLPCVAAGAPAGVVLQAARLLEVDTGRIVAPAEVLVVGERIAAVGTTVAHPAGASVVDLGDVTLMPGLIDAHIHLFLHPGAEDLQTVQESIPQRTVSAVLAARDDLTTGLDPDDAHAASTLLGQAFPWL